MTFGRIIGGKIATNIQLVVNMQTLKYLGDVNVALKNKPLASKFYNRALQILRKQLGSIDPTVKQLEQYVKQLNLKDWTTNKTFIFILQSLKVTCRKVLFDQESLNTKFIFFHYHHNLITYLVSKP